MAQQRINGVMLDMARVTERHEYYDALIGRLAAWGVNTIFAHFTDDEGCAMEFRRRPELTTPHALTQRQMRDWIGRARDAGIAVIPEIESFGHARYIFGRAKYARLQDSGPNSFYNALNPLHRESKAVLADLIAETAEVFDAPFIHAGLDEVNFGRSAQVRRALKSREKWEIFADHVEFMRGLVSRAGRRMMMWGDHLLKEPRIADRIPRDIVVCDWHYQVDVNPQTVAFFTGRGFDVVACPASNRSGDMVLPNAITQINLQRFARIARDGGPHVLGVMNTVWCPFRMLCGMEQLGLALGAAWADDPEADPVGIVARFLRGQFGLPATKALAETVLALSRIAPHRAIMQRLIDSEPEAAAPAVAPTACECRSADDLARQADRLADAFRRHRPKVKSNRKEYDNYILAAELLGWAGRLAVARAAGDRRALRSLLGQGRTLIKRCRADWNRGRYADDPRRDLDGRPGRWRDPLIPNLHLAVSRLTQSVGG